MLSTYYLRAPDGSSFSIDAFRVISPEEDSLVAADKFAVHFQHYLDPSSATEGRKIRGQGELEFKEGMGLKARNHNA